MALLRLLLRVLFPKGRSSASRRPSYRVRKIAAVQVPTLVQRTVSGTCYVIDGDTLVIDRLLIRLSGIDAPELDQPYGKNAKWALITLCRGQVVTAVCDGTSTHDREVATCYLPDGRDLSEEMVKLGMALDWRKFSGGKYRRFETHEARHRLWRADARQKGRFPPQPKV